MFWHSFLNLLRKQEMTIREFELLNEENRYISWLAKAVEVASYENDGCYYILYQMDSFYVELWTSQLLPGNACLIAFSAGERLEPYLEQIDIGWVKELI